MASHAVLASFKTFPKLGNWWESLPNVNEIYLALSCPFLGVL